MNLAHNPVLHSRTKHVKIYVFFAQEKVVTKQLVVQHISDQDQWADLFTKSLSSTRFRFLKDKLHVTEHSLVSQSP